MPCTSPRLARPFVWYRCAQFHGVGILQRPAGESSDTNAFSGEFNGGAEHGVGVLKTAACTYKGQFAHGQRNGCGLEVSSKTGQQFMGTFVKDERHGLALIQARGQKSGQVVLERWEHGVRTGEGASVTREYVGGAADAAAHLAAAAFQALAGVAENKADLARECSAADENTPPPPLAALGLKLNRVHKHIDHAAHAPATGREGVSDSVRSGSLVEQKLELAKTLDDWRNVLNPCKRTHTHTRTHSGTNPDDYCKYQIAAGKIPKVGDICLAKPQDAHPTQVSLSRARALAHCVYESVRRHWRKKRRKKRRYSYARTHTRTHARAHTHMLSKFF